MIGETALDAAGRPEFKRKADQLASDWLLPSNLLDEFIQHNEQLYFSVGASPCFACNGRHPWDRCGAVAVSSGNSILTFSVHADKS